MVEDEAGNLSLDYSPPGEQAARFHNEFGDVRGLLGPVGSGKSSTCVMEIILHSCRQKPYGKDKIRRARWAVIRNTYPELKTTTIKTWQQWIPDNVAPVKWDTPITSRLRVKDIGDGTGLDLEVIFLALDSAEDTGKLRSLELTGAWINEASEVPLEIFEMCTQRIDRYPAKSEGGAVDPCVILDTNPPDDDHWYYGFAEEETPKGWKFFGQPGGLMCLKDDEGKPILDANGRMTWVPNPDAENIQNLSSGYAYYERMAKGKTDAWISVFCGGEYGRITAGRPVYPNFNDKSHVAEVDHEAIPNLPIYLGWDFGLTPACVIAQPTPLGQLIVLDELIAEDMDVREFADSVVKPFLATKYPRFKVISTGDPAGIVRSQIDRKRTPFSELAEAGILTDPAETNDLVPRITAVGYFLNRMAGGKPAFILNRRCKVLRKGFVGGYHVERLKVKGSEAVFKDRPAKNRFSHPHDALQYLALRIRGGVNKARARTVQKTGKSRS